MATAIENTEKTTKKEITDLELFGKGITWSCALKSITRCQKELNDHEFRVGMYISERMLAYRHIQKVLSITEIKEGFYRNGKIIIEGTGIHEKSIKKAIKGLIEKGKFLLYTHNPNRMGNDDDLFFFLPCEASEKLIESMKENHLQFSEFKRVCTLNQIRELAKKIFTFAGKNTPEKEKSKPKKSKNNPEIENNLPVSENFIPLKENNLQLESAETVNITEEDAPYNNNIKYNTLNINKSTTNTSCEIDDDFLKKFGKERFEAYQKLLENEITDNKAKVLASEYSPLIIQNQIEYLPFHSNVKNKAGFLIYLIENNPAPPDEYHTALKKNELEEERNQYKPLLKIWDLEDRKSDLKFLFQAIRGTIQNLCNDYSKSKNSQTASKLKSLVESSENVLPGFMEEINLKWQAQSFINQHILVGA